MTLVLLHPLIAGLAVASIAVPIVVHLLLRQRPKVVAFPALQFLRARQTQTIRRLRFRHWLLLLLRALALLLLGLALARPTLRSSLFSIDQAAPMAVAFVMDTSASMSFVERGETRLQSATRLATEALSRLTPQSKVVLVESSVATAGAWLEVPAARDRLAGLETQADGQGLSAALSIALERLRDAPEERKELYLFSDQASNAWDVGDGGRLRALRAEAGAATSVYVVDVSAEKRSNVSLSRWDLPADVVATGAEAEIEFEVRNDGPDVDNIVRLKIDGEARGEQPIRLLQGQAVSLRFPLAGLAEGFHQGEISLAANDSLVMDDRRYFSIGAEPTPPVLVVADDARDALYWTRALAPTETTGAASVMEVRPKALAENNLSKVGAVCLLNVRALSPEAWVKLNEFTSRGGGVFFALGGRVDAENYNGAVAQQLLPGKLIAVESPSSCVITVDAAVHPIAARLARFGSLDLSDWPVTKYWKLEARAESSATALAYSSGATALVERIFGKERAGRSLLLTTAAHYDPEGESWNEIPLGWSYLVLAEEVVRYLGRASDRRLNFEVGEAVTLERAKQDPFTLYALTAPDGVVERIAVRPDEKDPLVPTARLAGQYALDASQEDRTFRGGFSMNVSPRESDGAKIDRARIEAIFGVENVSVVRDPSELELVEGTSRVGRELFPWLILLVVLVLFCETYLSNRFYPPSKVPMSPVGSPS